VPTKAIDVSGGAWTLTGKGFTAQGELELTFLRDGIEICIEATAENAEAFKVGEVYFLGGRPDA